MYMYFMALKFEIFNFYSRMFSPDWKPLSSSKFIHSYSFVQNILHMQLCTYSGNNTINTLIFKSIEHAHVPMATIIFIASIYWWSISWVTLCHVPMPFTDMQILPIKRFAIIKCNLQIQTVLSSSHVITIYVYIIYYATMTFNTCI